MGKDSNGNVLILIGSDSDLPVIESCTKELSYFSIAYTLKVASAHRTPEFTKELVSNAEKECYDLIIAAAGLAAHLPGVCASLTTLPVIGIPLDAGPLSGIDALYSIVQMPSGLPVGCMGIGKSGAKNAGVYAAQVLSLKYGKLKELLYTYKEEQKKKVLSKNKDIKA
ncbi:5-(carboxyamino)imidazole ribonucleotide mutase [Spirochaetota bacterium]